MSKSGFIVFEGLDHSGKTTQIDLAEKWLLSRGHDVVRFREPGATPAGERIRQVLLDPSLKINTKSEIHLFMAARWQLVIDGILPAIAAKKLILLDRYWYSTAVYQGSQLFDVLGVTQQMEREGLPQPDFVFYLDGDPEVLARRHVGPSDRIESNGVEYQKLIRQGYKDLSTRIPIFTVNAERTPLEVQAFVESILENMGF